MKEIPLIMIRFYRAELLPRPRHLRRTLPEPPQAIRNSAIPTIKAAFSAPLPVLAGKTKGRRFTRRPSSVLLVTAPYVVARGFTQITVAGTTLGTPCPCLILQSASESDVGVAGRQIPGWICFVSFSVPVSM